MSNKPATRIMGILNVTPDSFSDGGEFHDFDAALAQAEQLISEGADILDVGGESTRPYADPVSLKDELARTIPVIEKVHTQFPLIPISIDTTKAEVARRALAAGATIINDISALRKDPEMISVACDRGVEIIIMHMQGSPEDMQDRPSYDNVIDEIVDFFKRQLAFLQEQGIKLENVTIDPGIGFGKNLDHNLSIIKHLDQFKSLGCQLLLGHSRKSFLGLLTEAESGRQRDLPTAVVSALAVAQKVDIVRVHNVEATRQALQVAEAIASAA